MNRDEREGKAEDKWLTSTNETSSALGFEHGFIGAREIKLPMALRLERFKMDMVPGTNDRPASYESFVELKSLGGTDVPKQAHIFMNNPLRYDGLTFYQHQMVGEDLAMRFGEIPSSTLQVVRNPSWLTPYAGCLVVAAGMLVQFMIHLVGFVSKRKVA